MSGAGVDQSRRDMLTGIIGARRVWTVLELVPAPRVHTDLAATSALAATHEQRAAPIIEIGLGEGQRFLDPQPGTPEDHDQAT